MGSVRANQLEAGRGFPSLPAMQNSFRFLNSSPEVIRLTVMMYIRYLASVHASIHNHFNQARHLSRREVFMQDRAAAIAKWRQFFGWTRCGPAFVGVFALDRQHPSRTMYS